MCSFKKKIDDLRRYDTKKLIPRSQNDDSNDYVLEAIKNNESKNKQEWFAKLKVKKLKVKCLFAKLDTCTQCDVSP